MSRKIIILSDDFPPKSGGGAAIIASIHASAMVLANYETIVITTVEDRAKVGEFLENGIKIIRLYSKYNPRFRSILALYNPLILSKIKEILKREKPDIVHVHNIHYHISYHSLSIAKRYSKTLFMTIHDSMPFHYSKLFPKFPYETQIKSYKVSLLSQLKDFRFRFNPFKNIIIRYYLLLPNKIFAVSGALKNALLDNGIKNVEVINNGIDLEKWKIDQKDVEEFKKEYSLFDKKVILFCGRLSRAKGGEVLVRNMPSIIKEIPNAVILIVGDKDNTALEMLKQAQNLGIEQSLVFTGKLSGNSLLRAYGASDLAVVASLCFDWFPTVNLESMAMKLPVVATCFGGSSEIIADEINGYIINPYNEDELIGRIIDILGDDEKAKRFGEAGYERLKSEFGLDKYIQKTIFWYNKFL